MGPHANEDDGGGRVQGTSGGKIRVKADILECIKGPHRCDVVMEIDRRNLMSYQDVNLCWTF